MSALEPTPVANPRNWALSPVAKRRSLQLGQELHRANRKRLRFPGLSFRPGAAMRGQEDRLELRRPCDPALRARAGGGFSLRPAWGVRATMGQVGRGWLTLGIVRLHYNCRSRRAEPILCANAPASATAAYCWKQANLAGQPHSLIPLRPKAASVRTAIPPLLVIRPRVHPSQWL